MYSEYSFYNSDSTLLPKDTAIYVRLSEREKERGISDSISNQKRMLKDYADELDLNIIGIYVDEYKSGSTFQRPVFQEMIQDIEKGIVNCVLIKDLSRFGREHVDADHYLERYFPSKGVRFICLNKKLDSFLNPARMSEIDIAFENLLNEETVKQVSSVTKATLRVKMKEGLFVGVRVPYGYKRDPHNKHKLIVDEKTYQHVQFIFREFLAGKSISSIVYTLNESGIDSPSTYANKQLDKPINPNSKWGFGVVKCILSQDIYTGDMVQGKTYSFNHKVKKRLPVPKEHWIIKHNTHEEIIDKHTFKTAQIILNMGNRPKQSRQSSIFAGLIYCKDCNCPMTRNSSKSKSGKVYYRFVCSTYKKQGKKTCQSHFIIEKAIYDIVLLSIKNICNNLCDVESRVKYDIELKINKLAERLSKEIKACEKRKTSLKNNLLDLHSLDLNEDEFQYNKQRINSEIAMIDDSIAKANKSLKDLYDSELIQDSQIEMIKSYNTIEKLDNELVKNLIEKIYVDENANIEIIFKFKDVISDYFSKKAVI